MFVYITDDNIIIYSLNCEEYNCNNVDVRDILKTNGY